MQRMLNKVLISFMQSISKVRQNRFSKKAGSVVSILGTSASGQVVILVMLCSWYITGVVWMKVDLSSGSESGRWREVKLEAQWM